jgi:multicomponent Na+:H+ antiporter subunit F
MISSLASAGSPASAGIPQATPGGSVAFAACLVLLVGALLLLIRALRGPTVYDRILAVNALGTKTVVLVACIGFVDAGRGNPSFFLDTSIVYALINFVATIAILKYIQYRRLN